MLEDNAYVPSFAPREKKPKITKQPEIPKPPEIKKNVEP